MSNLATLKAAGKFEQLQGIIAGFALGANATNDVLQIIESDGVKGPKVMKKIGELQRSNQLKPGLWKEIVEFTKTVGETTQQVPASAGQGEVKVSEATQEAPASATGVELKLSEKEEEKLRARLLKEEQNLRARLAEKAKKHRERMLAKLEKRGQRSKPKIEEAAEVKAAREAMAPIKEQIKTLRESIKVHLKVIKDWKAAQPKKEKKPKKVKPPKEGEAAAAPAAEAQPSA